MPHGVLHRVGVLEVAYPLVPVVAVAAPQIGTRDKGLIGVQGQLGLEDIGRIAGHVGRRRPLIDEEDRDRPRIRRDQVRVAYRTHRRNHVEPLPSGDRRVRRLTLLQGDDDFRYSG